MKLAVINFSGNVGKTTVTRHLLAPRIPGCQVVAIETINADGGQQVTIRGRQYALLQEYLQTVSDVVVDVGASNVEDLLALMRRYSGSHEDFDGFIVPTVPARKQQQDTAATLAELARIGVPTSKLRLVFNMVDDGVEIGRAFDPLLAFVAQNPVVVPNLECRIEVNEIFERIKGSQTDLATLAGDPTDYRALIARSQDTAEKLALAQKLANRRLALGVVPALDACFRQLKLAELPGTVTQS